MGSGQGHRAGHRPGRGAGRVIDGPGRRAHGPRPAQRRTRPLRPEQPASRSTGRRSTGSLPRTRRLSRRPRRVRRSRRTRHCSVTAHPLSLAGGGRASATPLRRSRVRSRRSRAPRLRRPPAQRRPRRRTPSFGAANVAQQLEQRVPSRILPGRAPRRNTRSRRDHDPGISLELGARTTPRSAQGLGRRPGFPGSADRLRR